MHIKNDKSVEGFSNGDGETAYELVGHAVGPKEFAHSVAYLKIDAGACSQNHYHPVCEESYFITKGEARMVIDGEEKILVEGDCVLINPKQHHQIFNNSETTLEFIAVCVPPWTPDCSVFLD